jgi:hypothetical protein
MCSLVRRGRLSGDVFPAEIKPELKLSVSDSVPNSIDGDIRAIVRGNRPVNVVGSCDDILAAGAPSIADIEKLMAELQTARDYLQAEGERVHRLTTRYAHQTASGLSQDHRREPGQKAQPGAGIDQQSPFGKE